MIVSHYLCPECGTDWSDTWECAVNSQCPSCGIKDIQPEDRTPEECCNMEMIEAFETVLMLARARADSQPSDLPTKTALGLVTAYFLLKVKG